MGLDYPHSAHPGSDSGRKRHLTEQTEGHGSRSHTYVEMHLEGSSVQRWSLPDRSCVFGTTITDPHWKRTYIALRDTA